jgi:catechol 2,3-dioxygenase
MSPDTSLGAGQPPFNILRAASIEYRVSDLGRVRAFYVDLLGFVESGRDADRLYLRGYEEHLHHSLVLRRAPSPGVGNIAFRVASEEDLDRLEALGRHHDLPVRRLGETCGLGRVVRVQDPAGLPVEFFHRIDRVESLLQRFDLHRGAHVARLDHFNCQVADVEAAARWYQRTAAIRRNCGGRGCAGSRMSMTSR